MKNKFNLISKDILESNSAFHADNFGETLKLITQIHKMQEDNKENSIEQRLRRLEEAVFGDMDDGR